jgi:DNA-binding FrmR family transcriptional regulator
MHGYAEDKPLLIKRLHRIEGQVRGIERMVEEDRYCIDILTQIAATRAALDGVALKVLEDHVRHCVREGGEEKVTEVTAAIERLIRSR